MSSSPNSAKLELVNYRSFVPIVHLDLASGSGSILPQINATLSLFLLQAV